MKYVGLYDNDKDVVTKDKLDAVKSTVPTKTSQLDNDSGFITSDEVPSEVFIATYGTTTYEEIKAAYDAGKVVLCKYNEAFIPMIHADNVGIYFFGLSFNAKITQITRLKSMWLSGETVLVPDDRTINGKALSDDITLTASDVAALPNVSVTTSDNGKFLRVVNGAWAAVAIADASGVKF